MWSRQVHDPPPFYARCDDLDAVMEAYRRVAAALQPTSVAELLAQLAENGRDFKLPDGSAFNLCDAPFPMGYDIPLDVLKALCPQFRSTAKRLIDELLQAMQDPEAWAEFVVKDSWRYLSLCVGRFAFAPRACVTC